MKKIVQVLFEHLGVTLDEPRIDALIALKMVNMNFYPTCPNPDLTVGVGRHSDMGILTVLLQDGIGGLYIKLEQEEPEKEGEWMEIPPVPGALVINVGDTLQVRDPSFRKFMIRAHIEITFIKKMDFLLF